jgi:cobalt-zinc-cadmium efflux system outer membrane protein
MMNYWTDFGFQSKFTCFLLVLISAIFPLSGQQNLTLQEALAQAQNNQLYQARLEQIEVLKARVQQAEKRPNPRLETEFETGAIAGDPDDHLISLVFANTWERGGARGLRQQIAQAEVQQATLDAEDYMRVLTSEIRLAYLELLQLQKQVSLLEIHSGRINKVFQFDQVRVREGEIPSLNPEYLSTELAGLEIQKGEFENQLWLARYRLNVLLGAPAETEHMAVEEDTLESALPAVDQVLSFALKNRADLRKMRGTIEQADLQFSMEEAEAARDWEWGVGYHRIGGTLKSDDFVPQGIIESAGSAANLLELRLTIPLPLWDNNSGNLAAALATKKVRERELAHAEFLVRSEVLSAYQEYQLNQKGVQLYRETLVPKLQETLQRLEAAYQLTGEDVLDWLEIQRSFLGAALQGLEADFQVRASVVKLEQAVGGSLEEVMQ